MQFAAVNLMAVSLALAAVHGGSRAAEYPDKPVRMLVGGEVQLVFATAETAVPQIKSGKIRALGVTIAKRTPQEFSADIKSEMAKWSKVVKASGAKAE